MTEIKEFDLGNQVLCDLCGIDYTNDNTVGGITFGSKAICPKCAPSVEKNAKKYKETNHIGARCPENMSFATWVHEVLREGESGTIQIITM